MALRNFLKENFPLFFLLILSFLTRFWRLWYPPKVVFDEAHFGLYATKYLLHQYYWDIHPPFGKLILALAAWLGEIKPGFDFGVNSYYGDFNYLILRSVPTFFGSLFPILIYFFVLELGFSKKSAFLASFLLIFDNALLVQSRLILLDIILLFFIFLSLYFFLLAKKSPPFSKKWYFFNFLSSFSLAAAISTKLIGFGAMLLILTQSFFKKEFRFKKETLAPLFFHFFLPFCFYFLIYALHIFLLPNSCYKNCGAVLTFSGEDWTVNKILNFRPEGSFFKIFYEIQKYSLAGNLVGWGPFYYESRWFSWPFMIRPVKYFFESENGKISAVYFLGNPIVWWLSTLGVIAYFYLIAKNYFLKFKLRLPKEFYFSGFEILIAGYLIFLLPFAAIERFTVIYHYLTALSFSVIIFSVFFSSILKTYFQKYEKFFYFFLLFLVFLFFLYFSPLTYGFDLSEKSFNLRMWLSTWNY